MEKEELEFYRKQLQYIKIMGYNVDDKRYLILFPMNWFIEGYYKLRIDILNEAISKKCLIVDTDLYGETMMERVIDYEEKTNM